MERARTKRERFVVSRNGEPTLVMLSVEDYVENILKQPASLAALQKESRQNGLNRLTMADINREISVVRREERSKNMKRHP